MSSDQQMSHMSPITINHRFGWLHTPKGELHSTAVVLCPGLRYDELTGYGSLRLLADALAECGYPTLRIHYSGTGNSCDRGNVDYWTVWQEDIHSAAEWLRTNCSAQQIVLCGFRFGAALAAMVAASRADAAGLVLLAPVMRGRSYARQLIMESGRSSGGHVDLGRLQLAPNTIASINQFELRRVRWREDCKVAAFFESASATRLECETTWMKNGISATSRDFTGLVPMLRPTFAIHEDSAEVGPIVKWLSETLPARPYMGQQKQSWSCTGIKPEGCIETPLAFGRNHDLFGILCHPNQVRSHVAVLIGNASGDPHCAGAAVGVARHLAAEGIASLRFDFTGIGDSAPASGGNHVFETDRTGDFVAAMDALEALGFREFAAQGLCSGAYHAYHAAVADHRIKFALLINLPFFKWARGFPVEELSFDLRPPTHFIRMMGRKAFWLSFVHKLLRGDLNVHRRFASIETRLGRFPEFVQELEGVSRLSERVRMLFLVSEGDVSIEVLKRTFGKRSLPAGTKIELVPELDHAMTVDAMRRTVAKRMAGFLIEQQVTGRLHRTRDIRATLPLPAG
jgi:alpha/beta superfamily hydrolase